MLYQLFSIYDQVADVYHLPFASASENEAIRSIRLAASVKDSQLFNSPEDFSLYSVGTYDDSTGTYQNFNAPRLLVKVITLKPYNNFAEVNEDGK